MTAPAQAACCAGLGGTPRREKQEGGDMGSLRLAARTRAERNQQLPAFVPSCWLSGSQSLRFWFAVFGCCAVVSGCAAQRQVVARPAQHGGICFMPRDRAHSTRPVRAHDWVKLLVQLELGQGGVFAVRDCSGRAIAPRPEPRGRSCLAEPDPPRLDDTASPTPIGTESIIQRSLGRGRYLLWLVSHHYGNGDGFGPLALAQIVPSGVEVEALGTLRMRTQRVSLDLWDVRGESVLVASGENCSGRGAAERCKRAARLLVNRESRLLDSPLLDEAGRCVQEAAIELGRRQEQTLASGLRRSFELTSSLSHDARHVVIEERLVVQDTDPSAPMLPPREVQRIEANRFVRVQNGQLISRQHPLWNRALRNSLRPGSDR